MGWIGGDAEGEEICIGGLVGGDAEGDEICIGGLIWCCVGGLKQFFG